jgi:GxxExxY protein
MSKIIYKDESYKLMGILFDIHNNLGKGFSEIVYKDAIEYEFEKSKIFFEREKEYQNWEAPIRSAPLDIVVTQANKQKFLEFD